MREFEAWALKELGNSFGIAALNIFTPGSATTTSGTSVIVSPDGDTREATTPRDVREAIKHLGEGCTLHLNITDAKNFYVTPGATLRRARGLVGPGQIIVYPDNNGDRIGFATWENGRSATGSVAPGGIAPVLEDGRIWLVPTGVL